MFRGRSPTFSFATFNNEWISLSLKTTCTLMDVVIVNLTHTNMVLWTSTTTTHATMMVAQKKIRSYVEWTPSDDFIPLLIEMYGFLHYCFDLFFYHLCIDHYRTSSTIFLSPLDAYFLLSTTHVHSLTTCTSHNDSSAGCCTWLGFLIFFTHHS
jgi:hypothetical protein